MRGSRNCVAVCLGRWIIQSQFVGRVRRSDQFCRRYPNVGNYGFGTLALAPPMATPDVWIRPAPECVEEKDGDSGDDSHDERF